MQLARVAVGVIVYARRHPDDPAAVQVLDLAEGVVPPDVELPVVAADDEAPGYWWERN